MNRDVDKGGVGGKKKQACHVLFCQWIGGGAYKGSSSGGVCR